MSTPAPKTKFEIAMNAYKAHVHDELSYTTPETTLMLIGFCAGWEAHRDVVDQGWRKLSAAVNAIEGKS